ncbi:HAD superfamily hydrolase (TIGR01509 family) [Acinetobacter calcoaceticus]|uniref:HAD superfamily hydrolase (TIGR01509 family) n=1 Tax=Acinetobacter calcoaceticus TaxID=471 RepID=A0A4R1XKG8_ACICA|nr:HAD superfamily hydrolase (TIGR01509 family) [Acinetobacter calcoaceticus]
MLIFQNHPIHGAIFDMDGTMFDTERLRFQTLQQASQELMGIMFSEDYLMQCLGLSEHSSKKLAQLIYGQNIPYTAIRIRSDQLEGEYIRDSGVPMKNGLVQLLERLKNSGLSMAVATSSRREIAEAYLKNANITNFFDLLICGEDVKQGKPDPEIFLTAAEQLNLDVKACLMFEDSKNGLCSAYKAGGITVLIKDIKAPNQAMLGQASYYFESLYDCLKALN